MSAARYDFASDNVVGAKTAVDDLRTITRVAGVGEIGAHREQVQRRAIAQFLKGVHRKPGLAD